MRPWFCVFAGILLVFLSTILPSDSLARQVRPIAAPERVIPEPPTVPPERVPPERVPPERTRPISPLVNCSRHAGLIFSGSVVRVERVPGKRPKDVETVAITFHIDRGFRGVRTGQLLTIREWAGLWVAQPRYRVGEKLLLFLYPPSRLGLTSPVSEVGGRYRVDTGNRVLFSPAQRAWFAGSEIESNSLRSEGLPLKEFLEQTRSAGDLP